MLFLMGVCYTSSVNIPLNNRQALELLITEGSSQFSVESLNCTEKPIDFDSITVTNQTRTHLMTSQNKP